MNAALGAGLGMVSVLVIIAVFCDVLAPNNPDKIDMSVRFAERSFAMPLGADAYGRCIFSRLLYGTRYSMGLAAAVIGTVAVLATPIGMIAAFKGGLRISFLC